jgi:hypothetical protein
MDRRNLEDAMRNGIADLGFVLVTAVTVKDVMSRRVVGRYQSSAETCLHLLL